MIAAPGRKVIPYLALRSGGRGERAILWREGVFSRQATSAKITGATDSTPRLHDTKHRQRNRQRCFGLKESGRRDLNPRPPEPHSGALPDCATSRCHSPNPTPLPAIDPLFASRKAQAV